MSIDPIVVGTDGSPSAERAVDRAAELARALGVPLHIVNSYSVASSAGWMAAAGGIAAGEVYSDDAARGAAEEIVTRSRQRLAELGIDVHTHACDIEPAEALLTIATGEGAQMIVVGNRGMTGARRMLGSVPNRVSHHAACAVLIVPTT
jgi:nucleotide-binding universal stress UspA family protein